MKTWHVSNFIPAPQFLQVNDAGKNYSLLFHGTSTNAKQLINSTPGSMGKGPARDYELVCFPEKGGSVWLAGEEREVAPGMIYPISPGEERCIYRSTEDENAPKALFFTFSMVHARKDEIKRPFHEFLSLWSGLKLQKLSAPFCLSPPAAKIFTGHFNQIMAQQLPHGYFRWLELHGAIYQLLMFLVKEVYANNLAEEMEAKYSSLHLIRREIEEKLTEPLLLTELAKMTPLSVSQICRSFRTLFGATPIQYQIILRIERACLLLDTSGFRVGEIGKMLGFHSPFYFSRLFKQYKGMSPREWRKRPR